MVYWKHLQEKLKLLETQIHSGRAAEALEQLNLLLAGVDAKLPENAFICASILRVMSEAANQMGDPGNANLFVERAVELLRWSIWVPVTEQVEIFISLAESLALRGRALEAMHFAESALQIVADNPDEFVKDTMPDLLQRYATLARSAGYNVLAQTACTMALVVVHAQCGVESQAARNLLSHPHENPSPFMAIDRVGEFLREALSC